MERLERLYGLRALLIKGAYCFFLPLLQVLFTSGVSDAPLWLFLSAVLLGSLYTVPFWCTLYALKRIGKRPRLLRLIALDAGCCLLPAVVSALAYETVVHLSANSSPLDGLYTLLVFFILLLISGLFWLLYLLTVHKNHTRP